MDAIERAHQYFAAWNRRDADAVLQAFAPGGTYQDPTTTGPLNGDPLRAYLRQLWSAFPDLGFELGPVHAIGEGVVHGEWTMVGTNTGSMLGLPPTGKPVRLPGIDVIVAGDQGLLRVTGYFDSALLPRQLGLDVLVQPRSVGPLQLGSSASLRGGTPAASPVVALTDLAVRDEAAVAHLRELSRQVLMEQAADDAFQFFSGTVVGCRMTTLTGWSSLARMQAAMRRGTHARAMREFFQMDSVVGGTTAVYTLAKQGAFHARCGACGRLATFQDTTGRCGHCGAAVQALA